MSITSIYPILGLDKEAKELKKKDIATPVQDISILLAQYQKLLEVAEKVSSTLLIRHNEWIVQVKSIRQHYLFENEETLTEEQSMAKCAIEISTREVGKQANLKTLYTIRCNDQTSSYTIKNEQQENKSMSIGYDDPQWISKLINALK